MMNVGGMEDKKLSSDFSAMSKRKSMNTSKLYNYQIVESTDSVKTEG
jgi:hypothetical protein